MNNQDGDHWYTIPVSIMDSITRIPLNCTVTVQDDKLSPNHCVMVCFIAFSVELIQVEDECLSNTCSSAKSSHCIQRKSEYSPNGKATFRICFYHAGTILVSVGIHSILDEEGMECIGYNVDQCVLLMNVVRYVEKNAFRSPPLIKMEGPLASRRFQRLMSTYRRLFYRGRMRRSNHDGAQNCFK